MIQKTGRIKFAYHYFKLLSVLAKRRSCASQSEGPEGHNSFIPADTGSEDVFIVMTECE